MSTGNGEHDRMQEAIQENTVETKVLSARVEELARTGDRRHIENKASLVVLEERVANNQTALTNVSQDVKDLNVKLTGWDNEGGKGGIKGDITKILARTENLPALIDQAAAKAVAQAGLIASAGRWRSMSAGARAAVIAVVTGLLIVVLGAVFVAALHLTGAAR